MEFNLIEKQWIPVLRRDGTPDMIAPHEVTDQFSENPVVSLNAPRPDFNGALIQFLIGLVQTVAAPQSGAEWRKRLKEPPTPEELKEKFATVHHAFELGGDGPRFMQDFEQLDVPLKTIDSLLVGEPSENALDNNTDFFVKRKVSQFAMCPPCSAAALLTLQTNAPAGGRGYMTSLRGGGPLTTLIKGTGNQDLLWHSIWLNVLENTKFLNLANSRQIEDSRKFPWLSKMIAEVTEQDMHPAQFYWAMPRRLKLVTEFFSGNCSVCSCPSDELISSFKEKPNGTKYKEPMKHPLSAFSASSTKAVLTQPGGVSYRHWLGLIFANNEGNSEPARVIHEYIQQWKRDDWQLQVWAFGYDFVPGQNKVRCWYESQMPLLLVDPSIRSAYEDVVAGMVKAAVIVGENLRIAIKNAIHGKAIFDPVTQKIKWEYRDIKKLATDEDKRRAKVLYETREDTALISVESNFWQNTELQFYELLSEITRSYSGDATATFFLEDWHSCLCNEAQRLFDLFSWEIAIEDSDPKRIVIARNEMGKYNRGSYVKKLLGI